MALLTALVRTGGNVPDIERVDVVVWNLTGILKTQRLIFDVGITFGHGPPVDELDLVVPFVVAARSQCEDLSNADSKAIDLLSPNLGVRGHEVDFDGVAYERVEVTDFEATPFDERRALYRRPISHVKLSLSKPVVDGYVRARFHVVGATAAVIWKRSGIGINGAIFDVEPIVGDDPETLPRMFAKFRPAPVASSSVAVILRSSLQRQASYPSLEGALLPKWEGWERHLNRRTDFRRQGNLVAYRDSLIRSQVSGRSQRRMFLDVSREFGLLPVGNLLRHVWVAPVTAGVLVAASPDVHWDFGALFPDISGLAAFLGSIGLLSASGIGVVVSRVRLLRARARDSRVWLHRVERRVLSTFVQRQGGA